MNKFCKMLLITLVISIYAGCGGGGNESKIDPNIGLIGTWQPIQATLNDTTCKVCEAMFDTSESITLWKMEFRQDGNFAFRGYASNNSLAKTIEGKWNSVNGIASLVFDGKTTEMKWHGNGSYVSVEFLKGNVRAESGWVKISPNISGTDPMLVGTWSATEVRINGHTVALKDYFGWSSGSTSERLIFDSNNVYAFREMKSNTIVKTEFGTWYGKNNVMSMSLGYTTYIGGYEASSNGLGYMILDPKTGNSIHLIWKKL